MTSFCACLDKSGRYLGISFGNRESIQTQFIYDIKNNNGRELFSQVIDPIEKIKFVGNKILVAMTHEKNDRGYWIIDDDQVKIIETNYPDKIVDGR